MKHNSNKPQLKYRVIETRNPKTGNTLLRPIITDRMHYDFDDLVNYAIAAGYVAGPFHQLRGQFCGLIEAIRQLLREGADITLDGFLRFHGELSGTVSNDRKLTEANAYRINITALSDFKSNLSDFAWKQAK